MYTKATVRTLEQSALAPHACNIIQDNGPSASTETGKTESLSICGLQTKKRERVMLGIEKKVFLTECRESQLPAHYAGIYNLPAIVADCAPGIVVADFHTSLV